MSSLSVEGSFSAARLEQQLVLQSQRMEVTRQNTCNSNVWYVICSTERATSDSLDAGLRQAVNMPMARGVLDKWFSVNKGIEANFLPIT